MSAVWLSESFWDIEDEQAGSYRADKKNALISSWIWHVRTICRIKITLEHFRSLTLEENPQRWATQICLSQIHGGPLRQHPPVPDFPGGSCYS